MIDLSYKKYHILGGFDMNLTFLGFLSIVCALLVTFNKGTYNWLVTSFGFKNNPKIAIYFYAILGFILIISSLVDVPYINEVILPASVLFLSLIAILLINSKKNDQAKS